MDFLNELENKVNALITTLESMRQENSRLKEEIESNNGRIQGIEEENARLKEELEAQRVDSQGAKEKMNVAAERIQNLLSKLDTAVQQ
ncbi:MAG: cell division protein ZapB [Fibrobacter sp.]|nr:cell division protein ZapB [Fibrobacter sp.]